MSDFQPGLPADQAHARLRESLRVLQHAEKNAVLWFDEIRRRRLFRQLGYSTIHAYAISELGFSKSRCSQFIRLTESLEKLPKLRESIAKGDVAWTKARELVKVASPQNEERWVAEAKRSSRRELEAKVKVSRERARSERRRNPAQASLLDDVGTDETASAEPAPNLTCESPVNVSLRFTPEQFARYEALVEQLHKKNSGRMQSGLPASKLPSGREELMLAGLSALLDVVTEAQIIKAHTAIQNEFPRGNSGPAFQVVIHKCEDCERASVVSGRGNLALSKATLDRIDCDSQVLRPGERNKASIPPGLRRRVLSRDGHRCRASGCGSTRFLEVHHVRPRAAGGGNEANNLVTLCADCHQLLHEMGEASVKAPKTFLLANFTGR